MNSAYLSAGATTIARYPCTCTLVALVYVIVLKQAVASERVIQRRVSETERFDMGLGGGDTSVNFILPQLRVEAG